MLASFLKRDPKNLNQRDASPNFQAQNGLLSLRSWWRSVRSLRIIHFATATQKHGLGIRIQNSLNYTGTERVNIRTGANRQLVGNNVDPLAIEYSVFRVQTDVSVVTQNIG